MTIRNAQTDAVHLAAGCTGTIGKLTVVQYHGDGVKVAPGVHDLTVGGGSIRCYGHDPGKHQDGIQAMGGQHVTFVGIDDQCLSANNAAFFVTGQIRHRSDQPGRGAEPGRRRGEGGVQGLAARKT